MNRRDFSKLLVLNGLASISGCHTLLPRVLPNPDPGECLTPNNNIIKIDMHCHLLNLRDGGREAFVARRILNADESNVFKDFFGGIATWLISTPMFAVASGIQRETAWVKVNRALLQEGPQEFCNIAASNQAGIFFADSHKQKTGFLGNRTRNAQRMMHLFPSIDLFTPSMVDFYEGHSDTYSSPFDQMLYYKELHIASNARFVPLISFSPERAYAEFVKTSKSEQENFTPPSLRLVKEAILEHGFIGVKVHPSSGFSPIDNFNRGCPNTVRQKQRRLKKEQARYYDQVMMELFEFCVNEDVPILTHSGTGISANQECMERSTDPKNWTNSPYSWGLALDKVYQKTGKHLKLCLAHFAGGFLEKSTPHPWLAQASEIMNRHPNLYLDLSEMSEWFNQGGLNRFKSRKYFENYLKVQNNLKQKMMYGSDWHMPDTAQVGANYLKFTEEIIPTDVHKKTIGLNAVDFFGLKNGKNRKRLNNFYKKHQLDIDKIRWLNKLSSLS